MKIENVDAFRKWLVNILNPIFEGDPEKLALYIVALTKKVENDQASKQRCINDLDVFLESNTNSFVDTLFDALFNKTYLNNTSSTSTANDQNLDQSTSKNTETEDANKSRNIRRVSDSSMSNRASQRGRLSRDYQEIDVSSSSRVHRASSHGRRRKNRSRTRTHGISRSSSSSSSSPSPVRRSRSRSPYSRSRSRSPIENAHKEQSIKPITSTGLNSNITITLPNQQAFNGQEAQLQTQTSQPQAQQRQFNQKRNIQLNKNKQQRYMKNQAQVQQQQQQQQQRNLNVNNLGQQLNPIDNSLMYNPVQAQAQLPQQPLMQQRQIQTNRPRNLVNIVTSIHEDDQQNDHQQRGVKRSYNSNMNKSNEVTNNTNLTVNNNFNNNEQILAQQQLQQQQNIPGMQSQVVQPQPQQQALLPTPGMPNIGFNQPQQTQQQTQQQNTTLILKNIPAHLNNVDKIRQHFSKFGQILDIQCQYDQSIDAALVKFTTNKEAFAAFKSPQPVFNNRFIRLYWLSSYLKQQQAKQQQQHQQQQQQQQSEEPSQKRPAKERLSFGQKHEQFKSDTSLNTSQLDSLNKENLIKPSTSSTSIKKDLVTDLSKTVEEVSKKIDLESQQTVQQPKAVEDALTKKIQDENKKKALLLKLEVQKKARELIEQQIKDQKLLLKKYEQAKTVEEKNQILSLVKKLSEQIEKEKEILNENKAETEPLSPSVLSAQTPFSFQKTAKSQPFVIPPMHSLKLNNKKLTSTNFLKSTKLANQSNAPSQVLNKPAVVKTALQSPSLYTYSRVSVDNRPKTLLISGVENAQEKTNIINFINNLGCLIENTSEQTNETSNQISLLINFATRRDAEIALAKCSASLTNKKISISWFKQTDAQSKQQQQEQQEQQEQPEQKEEVNKPEEESEKKQNENENDKNESKTTENKPEDPKEVCEEVLATNEENNSINDSLANFLDCKADVSTNQADSSQIDENTDVFETLFNKTD